MLKEFKDFLIKGNIVDMAVGFIFGATFATFVKSLIENVLMSPI
ncbi:MscL family protein [Aliarcobacter butzleri]